MGMIVIGYNGGLEGYLARSGASDDAAASIVVDGEVIAASEEERWARAKHTGVLPERSIEHCLREVGLRSLDEVDLVAYSHSYSEMWRTEMLATTRGRLRPATRIALSAVMRGMRRAHRAVGYDDERSRMILERRTGARVPADRFVAVPQHLAHAAGAFFTSPFERALCLVGSGRGESASATAAIGRGTRIEVLEQAFAPDSLAHLYAAFATYLGFHPGDEHQAMSLAAYGDPSIHRRFFRRLVRVRGDGLAEVDPDVVVRLTARDALAPRGRLYPRSIVRELGPARRPGAPIEERHAHIAAALQETLEVALLASLQALRERTGERDLCIAGSLALNAAANGRIARSGLFERVHVQPASRAAGASMGAALYAYHHLHGHGRATRPLPSVYLGTDADDALVDRSIAIVASSVRASRPRDLEGEVVRALAAGKIVGWYQGRAEWGARALGARSVLADPRRADAGDRVRAAVKQHGSHRAFSPAVPVERAHELFDMAGVDESPHMLFCVPVLKSARERIPAVTHVDGSARVQTVSWEQNPRFHALLHAFGAHTGVPVLLNTSFNRCGEPIVNLPEDALSCFLGSGIDLLVIGERMIEKRGEASELTGSEARDADLWVAA
jgi:carbamoyltransferase